MTELKLKLEFGVRSYSKASENTELSAKLWGGLGITLNQVNNYVKFAPKFFENLNSTTLCLKIETTDESETLPQRLCQITQSDSSALTASIACLTYQRL